MVHECTCALVVRGTLLEDEVCGEGLAREQDGEQKHKQAPAEDRNGVSLSYGSNTPRPFFSSSSAFQKKKKHELLSRFASCSMQRCI